jgi:YgiT-type zinc finger domain-containing protein
MEKIVLPPIQPAIPPRICSECRAEELRPTYLTEVYETYTIENVLFYECGRCGEGFFIYETMVMLDEVHLKYDNRKKPLRSALC